MKRAAILLAAPMGLLLALWAQQSDVVIKLTKGAEKPALAVAEFQGGGGAQPLMSTFNATLFSDLSNSGQFRMVPKGMFPLQVPQQPSEFRGITPPEQPVRRGQTPPQPATGGGLYFSDWSSPPAQAGYLAFGYTAVQNKVLVLYGWLFNVTQTSVGSAQMLAKRYFGDVDANGARKIAHEFAADIIALFGGTSLVGSKIFFVSDRTGSKEIWSMDPDGSNQNQITKYRSLSIMPAVSPDGTKVAFTSYVKGNPAIFVYSVETGRPLPFYNQVASMNATPSFTPDGQHILYASTAAGSDAQIFIANLDGSDFRRLSYRRAIEVEPKVNPKTGSDILFVSGPGPQQIYKMDMNGANVEMVSPGGGEASNPAWHPDGQIIAFSWTRGYATGAFNVFIMDVATRKYDQLTHGEGRNENPSWAPDGKHLGFASTRTGRSQIWSMLADGTELHQLTTQGRNYSPVWGK